MCVDPFVAGQSQSDFLPSFSGKGQSLDQALVHRVCQAPHPMDYGRGRGLCGGWGHGQMIDNIN